MRCYFCEGVSVSSALLRVGEYHPAQDQRDTSRILVVPFCGGCALRAALMMAYHGEVGNGVRVSHHGH